MDEPASRNRYLQAKLVNSGDNFKAHQRLARPRAQTTPTRSTASTQADGYYALKVLTQKDEGKEIEGKGGN